MKTSDRLLLLAIAVILLIMGLLVFDPGPAASGPSLTGEPREVDVDLLRRRLIREELSDHEALYYR